MSQVPLEMLNTLNSTEPISEVRNRIRLIGQQRTADEYKILTDIVKEIRQKHPLIEIEQDRVRDLQCFGPSFTQEEIELYGMVEWLKKRINHNYRFIDYRISGADSAPYLIEILEKKGYVVTKKETDCGLVQG